MEKSKVRYIDDEKTKQLKNFLEKRFVMNLESVPFETYEEQHNILIGILMGMLKARDKVHLVYIISKTPVNIGYEDGEYIGLVRAFLFMKGYNIGLHFEYDRDLMKAVSDYRYKFDMGRSVYNDIFLTHDEFLKIMDKKSIPFLSNGYKMINT